MSSSRELSCFDCPILCDISELLKQSNTVRDAIVAESLHAMGEIAEIENSDQDCTNLRSQLEQRNSKVLSLLDSADKTLHNNRIGLLETCDDERPRYDNARAKDGKGVLVCSSVLAERAMKAIGIKFA